MSGDLAKPTLKQRAIRLMALVALVYALFVLIALIFQRRLIYLPTKLDPEMAAQIAVKEGFQAWRNKSGQIIGWVMPATGSATGSVLIVHGNAGCALGRDYLAAPIHAAAPVDVFILEYPGYGAREGSPSQQSLLAAADEGFNSISNAGPVFLVSESLGAGPVAYLAGKYVHRVQGLILFAPYDRFADVAQKKMPLLPVRLLLRDRYAPADWLKDYHGPVAFVLAGADEVIPNQFGRRLHDGYAGPKRLDVVEDAQHNDIEEQPAGWWKQIFSFWNRN